jgi:glucose/mannose-6-phosphate isomerase
MTHTNLDDRDVLKNRDKEGMLDVIDRFPSQCTEAIELGEGFLFNPPEGIDRVVVCGMGGSAMAGDIAHRFAGVPLFVNRGYDIPGFVGPDTLLVAVSYSGNTAETLSSFEQGIQAGARVLAISSGGRLKEASRERDIPFLEVPRGYQPRAAMGYLALPLLVLLNRLHLTRDLGSLPALIEGLEGVKAQCTPSVPASGNPAKSLAQRLDGRIPIVYGTVGNTDLVAMRTKTQINENAKQAAFWNVFPELNHNEILALVRADLLANPYILLLQNETDRREVRARMEIMMDLMKEHGVPFEVLTAKGKTPLAQVFSQIYFGDYLSTYLAVLGGVDPTPVELIEGFKKALSRKLSN